jgi:putative ABC transport system substrate-binding protein
MRRREFIAGLTLPLLASANAQQHPPMGVSPQALGTDRLPTIGVLVAVQAAEYGLRRGLSEAGFVEGRNVAFDYRWIAGQADQLPVMAAELASRNVAVIISIDSDLATRAAIAATQITPIVFTTTGSPVELGFVAKLGRPGSNATGVTTFSQELSPKRLELLREILPAAKKVVLLFNPNSPAAAQLEIESVHAAARQLGLEIIVVNASTVEDIERAITTAVQQQAGAILVTSDTFLSSRSEYIAVLALRQTLPTIGNHRNAVLAGQLMSYAANADEVYELAGAYVGRILKGEKPADLPVVQPAKFELVINLKAAKALGLTIPPTLLARADEVIE